MFDEFAHRHTTCTVDGVADIVILSRDSKGSSVVGKESMYVGRFSPTSSVSKGSMVVVTDSFLVQTLRITPDRDNYCGMVKTNELITVQRHTQTLDANGNAIGDPIFIAVQSNIKTFSQYVTAQLRQEVIGLLPTTVIALQMQTTVDIKRPDDPLLTSYDRVILNGRPYSVDVVDDSKFPNLLHVELSEDTR